MEDWGTTPCTFQLPTPSSKDLKDIEARGLKIIEYEGKVKYWQEKLDELLEEQDRYAKLVRIRINARSYWDGIYRSEQLEKEFILAALESKDLPVELQRFSEEDFPLHIRSDREIFLARVRHDDIIELDNIPLALRGDKEVMLECVKRQVQAIECLSDNLRADKDILRAVLHHPELPAQFLLQFSDELRSDASLVLEIFKHPAKEMSFIEHISQTLRSDKQFLLQVIECFQCKDSTDQRWQNMKPENQILRYMNEPVESELDFVLRCCRIPRLKRQRASDDLRRNEQIFEAAQLENHILRYLPQQLRGDFDFVMRCVRQSGFNLRHASDDLRGNAQIIATACKECGVAILYSNNQGTDEGLWKHKAIAKSVLTYGDDLGVAKSVIERYKGDFEVISMSVFNPKLEWSMIPDDMRSNTDFVIKALQLNPDKVWRSLPLETKSMFQVALEVVNNPNSTDEIVAEAIETCSDLLSNRKVLKHIILKHFFVGRGTVYRAVFRSGNSDIRNDKELMLAALSRCNVWRLHVSDELKEDRDFLLQVAEEIPWLFRDLALVWDSEMVIRVMQKHPGFFIGDDEIIRPDLWEDEGVVKAWLEIGGGWLCQYFEDFEDDEEVILVATAHEWHDFKYASHDLRKDKAFVLKALSIDTRILEFVDREIILDQEILIAATSKDVRCVDFLTRKFEDHSALKSFTQKIRPPLQEYWAFQAFQEGVLAPMRSTLPAKKKRRTLTMLNQGPVTRAVYESEIASCLGVMRDEDKIATYTAVSNHLAAWGV